MGFTIDKDRKEMFEIEPLEIEPERLKAIVSNVPKDDKTRAEFLKRLVSQNKITPDDVIFLLESGVLQN
ncbi:MAG: hypothetical protein ACYSR9_14810 [Planctomycetota bacterium]|jgi:hypothetical protein